MYQVNYEILTEDENGNDVWEKMTINVRERSAELAVFETKYYLQDQMSVTFRNVKLA